ncbi:MAG: O-antigen ligase family protein [Elusimicrobia bacterium]|nr:O-antigen ligase family protein [Elusimicrobiota bacterium]
MVAPLTARTGQSSLALALFVAPVAFLSAWVGGSSLWGPVSVVAVGLAWVHPMGVLFSLILLTPLCRFPEGFGLTPESLALLKSFLVLILFAVFYLKHLHQSSPLRFPSGLKLFWGAWLSLTLLSVYTSQDIVLSLYYLIGPLAGLAFFLIFYRLPVEKHRFWLTLILCVAGAVAALALIQYIFVTQNVGQPFWRFIIAPGDRTFYSQGPNIINATYQFRASGTFSHSNHLGIYIALLIPFSLVLALDRTQSKPHKWFFWGLMILMLLGLAATNSRAGLLACAVGMGTVGLHQGFRWLWGLVFAGVLVAMSVYPFFPGPLEDGLNRMLRVETRLSGRERIWREGISLIARFPWLGVGPGNLSKSYVSEFGYFVYNTVEEQNMLMETLQKKGEETTHRFHMHNLYLQLWAEMGVLGPLLFLAGALGLVFFLERPVPQAGLFSPGRAIRIATSSSVMGFLVFGLFESQVPFSMLGLNLAVAPLLAMGIQS